MFNYKSSKVSNSYRVFLLEIIVSIFFFAIFSAVTTKVFVGAYENNKRSIDLNNATVFCQDFMETFTAYNGDKQKTLKEFGFEVDQDSHEIYLDENMKKIKSDYTYKVNANFSDNKKQSGNLVKANIKVFSEQGREIYSLSNEIYVSNAD